MKLSNEDWENQLRQSLPENMRDSVQVIDFKNGKPLSFKMEDFEVEKFEKALRAEHINIDKLRMFYPFLSKQMHVIFYGDASGYESFIQQYVGESKLVDFESLKGMSADAIEHLLVDSDVYVSIWSKNIEDVADEILNTLLDTVETIYLLRSRGQDIKVIESKTGVDLSMVSKLKVHPNHGFEFLAIKKQERKLHYFDFTKKVNS